MIVWIKMKDGEKLRVECENIKIETSSLTGMLTSYQIDGIHGRIRPFYMPPSEIALIWTEKETGDENIESEA